MSEKGKSPSGFRSGHRFHKQLFQRIVRFVRERDLCPRSYLVGPALQHHPSLINDGHLRAQSLDRVENMRCEKDRCSPLRHEEKRILDGTGGECVDPFQRLIEE